MKEKILFLLLFVAVLTLALMLTFKHCDTGSMRMVILLGFAGIFSMLSFVHLKRM